MRKFHWSAGVLSLCLVSAAWAEQGAHEYHHHQQQHHQQHHQQHRQSTAGHDAAHAAMAEGEVLEVDRTTRRITLQHGDLPHLGMGPMSMTFRVQDDALLERIKVGDKVRFSAARVGGVMSVTAIEAIE